MNNEETPKVGDLITCCYKGYWKITNIERRYFTHYEEKRGYGKCGEEYSPLVECQLVCDDSGRKPVKKAKVKKCDMLYCQKIDLNKLEQIKQDYINKIDKIIVILKNNGI